MTKKQQKPMMITHLIEQENIIPKMIICLRHAARDYVFGSGCKLPAGLDIQLRFDSEIASSATDNTPTPQHHESYRLFTRPSLPNPTGRLHL
jgi:hypothetical protein